MVVAFHAATLATGRALPLTRTGLSPVGTRQLSWRTKVGLLELAKQFGNVSQACKMMGYSRDGTVNLCS